MSTFEMEDLWREAKIFTQSKTADELFKRIERRVFDEWTNSPPEKYEERDAAYQLVRAVRALRTELAALASEPDVTAFNRRLKGDR